MHMNETREMLKGEISKWIDYKTVNMSRTAKNRAVKELLCIYESVHCWCEGVMVTGASVDEINNWLKDNPVAEETLETYYNTSRLVSDSIIQGLGFEMDAITDVFNACIATIENVRAYAGKSRGYDKDFEQLDITHEQFIDAVRERFILGIGASYVLFRDNDENLTNRLIFSCFNTTISMLNETQLCQELNVTFVGYANSYGSTWHLECDEGIYEDFENNIDEIFDRLSPVALGRERPAHDLNATASTSLLASAKQEERNKNNKSIERD